MTLKLKRQGDSISGSRGIRGRVRGYHVYPSGGSTLFSKRNGGPDLFVPGMWVPRGTWQPNETLYGWASIVTKLLQGSLDGKPHFINTMYLEFENNGGADVTAPSFDRSGGKAYYDALAVDANRDYLRVGMTASSIDSTDETLFPGGNEITFFAQSAGVAGVHGKTFSDTVSSRVFGGALVSSPDFSDATQDTVHSRFYFSAANQLTKVAGVQLALTWPLQLQ